jgi:hypothetical protein
LSYRERRWKYGKHNLYSASGSKNEIQPRNDIRWSLCGVSLNPPPTLVIYNNFNEFGEDDTSQVTTDGTTALFRDSLLKDLTISYREEKFLAHKCFLSSCSNYFKQMVDKEWRDSKFCSIQDFPHIKSGDFRAFLKYLYTGDHNLLLKRAWSILHLCDYFDVLPFMKEEVILFLMKTLNPPNTEKFIPIVNQCLSDDPFAMEIRKRFIEFVIRNSKVLADEEFPFDELERPILTGIFRTAEMKV